VLPHYATEVKERDNNYYANIASQNGVLTSTFEAFFQAENPSLCSVAAFIDSATQFWQMYMFDHNCVLISSNPSVQYGDLLGGWGFDSELPKVTVLYIDYPPNLDGTSTFY
jgi:hypothetical protein